MFSLFSDHLKLSSRHLCWYQYLCLDVIALYLVLIVLLGYFAKFRNCPLTHLGDKFS